MTPANERRPAGAASEAWRPEPIVLADAIDELADALGWYEAGVLHGIEIGRAQLEAEWCGRQAVAGAIARRIAAGDPFDELCRRRGEPERAERQRRILAANGVIR